MNLATFSIKEKIPAAIKAAITHAVYEIVNDPDFGLELSDKAKRRLNKAK